MVAKQVFYSGRVQGVGFRYTTKKIAAEFDVTGWVHNLPDGRVELVAIAEDEEELQAFLTEVQENSVLANYIKATETRNVPPPQGVKGFSSGAGEAEDL
jgi:acylphosphatase